MTTLVSLRSNKTIPLANFEPLRVPRLNPLEFSVCRYTHSYGTNCSVGTYIPRYLHYILMYSMYLLGMCASKSSINPNFLLGSCL